MARPVYKFVSGQNGPSGAGGLTPVTPTDALGVGISFERCHGTNTSPPFVDEGQSIEVFAVYSWSHQVDGPVAVQGFTQGDISITVEDDPAVEDRIRLGQVNRGGVAVEGITGGVGGVYRQKLTLNPNSAASVAVTVLPNTAFYRPSGANADVYGPLQPITGFFGYSSIPGTLPIVNKPEVTIHVPGDLPFTEGTATIRLEWNQEMRQKADVTIGSAADSDIRLQVTDGSGTITYVTDSFTHNRDNNMTFMVTLTGGGQARITVKADAFTSINGQSGPSAATSQNLYFFLTYTTPSDRATGSNVVNIYDSGGVGLTSSSDSVIGSGGGAFQGLSDLRLIDGNLYVTAQVLYRMGSTIQYSRESRAVFFRIPTTARNSSSPTVLKRYDRYTESARSPIEVSSNVYFFEGSYVESGLGHLRSVQKTGTTIRDLGVPWQSRRPNSREVDLHTRTASNLALVDGNIYGQFGYLDEGAAPAKILAKSINWSSPERVNDTESTRIDNWPLLRYGPNLDFRLPLLQTNDQTAYNIIQEMAELTFCYTGFRNNTYLFKPRFQPRCRLDGGITSSATSLEIKERNMPLPSSGYLYSSCPTSREIIGYDESGTMNWNGTDITTATRGQYDTTASAQGDGADLRFINHVINYKDAAYREKPINEMDIRSDLSQLFNIIKINYGDPDRDPPIVAQNATSIGGYKSKELELSVPLDHHDGAWINWLAERYRDFYSTRQYLVQIELKPSYFIRQGDFILLTESDFSMIDNQTFQVIEYQHNWAPYSTQLLLRSIA